MTDDPVDTLYALPLDEFVAARNAAAAQARRAGDQVTATRIRELAKPTVAAWTVNQVTRHHPDDIERLLGLGAEMRAATAARDGTRLAELNRIRRTELDAFVTAVTASGQVGGRAVTTDTVRKLGETLEAAIIDPQSGEGVASGCLTRALQHVGFGVVDENGSPADVVSLSAARAARRHHLRVVDGDSDASSSDTTDSDASSSDTTGDDPTDVAQRALAAAEEEVTAATDELDRAEGERDAAAAATRSAAETVAATTAALDRVYTDIAALEAERDRLQDELAAAEEHAANAEHATRALEDRLAAAERRAEAARKSRREARATLRS